jgi:hypothetical protein
MLGREGEADLGAARLEMDADVAEERAVRRADDGELRPLARVSEGFGDEGVGVVEGKDIPILIAGDVWVRAVSREDFRVRRFEAAQDETFGRQTIRANEVELAQDGSSSAVRLSM